MAELIQVKYKLVFNGKNVTEELSPMVLSISYDDSVEGESSSLEITLENVDGLWSNGWYPNKGDKIKCSIESLECGDFTIDEVVLSGPPDIVKIRCLENVVTKQELRTKRSKAHEGKSLRQIAQHVASVNNLTLVGNVPNIMFERISQHRESDMKFLRRISYEFGIIFSVRDGKLIYTKLTDLDKKQAAFSIHRTDMMFYTCTDKTFNVFKAVLLKYHSPQDKAVISHSNNAGSGGVVTLRNNDGLPYPQITSGDTLVVHRRVESNQQAMISGDSILYRVNTLQQSGSFVIEGSALAVAGVNVEVTGLGTAASGIWNIRKCSHKVDRADQWVVSLEVKRIALISAERAKAKEDAKSGSLADLIGKGNMSDVTSASEYQNRNPKGGDVTKEKQHIQLALRFMVDKLQNNTFKYPTDYALGSNSIRLGLSAMVAKGQPETAQDIRVRWNDIAPGFILPNADAEDKRFDTIDKAEVLIGDIPAL